MVAKAPPKQQATAQERALAEVSQAQWDDYKARFRPAEVALAKDAELTQGEIARVQGEVSADTEAAFKGLTRATIASGEAAGADVSSGKSKLALAANAAAKGTAKGVGQSVAKTGAEIDSQGRRVQIAGFGRGIATDVTRNLSRGAQRATSAALQASDARFQKTLSINSTISTVAGAAARKFSGGFGDQEGDLVKTDIPGLFNFNFGSTNFGEDIFAKSNPFKSMSLGS